MGMPVPTTTPIGTLIRERRQRRNLTQHQLAELVGVTQKAISSWEIGRTEPGARHLFAIADALHLPLKAVREATTGEPTR